MEYIIQNKENGSKRTKIIQERLEKLSKKELINLIFEKDKQLIDLFELTNDALFIIDMNGTFLTINRKAADLLGYTIDELIGKSNFDFVVQEEQLNARKKLLLYQKGKILPIYERKFIRKDGTVITGEVNISVILDEKNKPKFLQSAIRDITYRKKIEEDLKVSEEKYRIIFLEAREGIVLIDYDTGQIIDANPEFQRQSGRTLEELQQLKIWEIRPKEIQEQAKIKFDEIKQKGFGQSSEFSFQQKDRKIIPIEFLSRKISIYGKIFLQSITRDISERKKYEKELLEKQELLKKQRDELESFASIAAHDIRGKLQVISLYNEMLNDSLYTEKITDQINDMVNFLNNLLLLSKQGEIIGEKVEVDLNQLIKEISSKIYSLAPTLTIKIAKLPILRGDYQKLQQVFENLLMNIVKHAKASKVDIYSVHEKNKWQIFIRDNGIGINNETQKRIQNAWQTKKYVTLGLMIVKKIVEAHNGTIEFHSKEGKGTTFILNFLE